MDIKWFTECNKSNSEVLSYYLDESSAAIASQRICENFQEQLITPTWITAMGVLISIVTTVFGLVKYGEFVKRKKIAMSVLSGASAFIGVISAVTLGFQITWLTIALSTLMALAIFSIVLLSPEEHKKPSGKY